LEEVWRMLVTKCTLIISELTSPDLFDDLYNRKNCCETGTAEGMLQSLIPGP
jgi:hypothetical protein